MLIEIPNEIADRIAEVMEAGGSQWTRMAHPLLAEVARAINSREANAKQPPEGEELTEENISRHLGATVRRTGTRVEYIITYISPSGKQALAAKTVLVNPRERWRYTTDREQP